MTTLDAAQKYADNGWAVFPLHGIVRGACTCGMKCDSPGKHPMTKNGLKDATTDFDQIKEWFTRWPSANVAIATGQISGLWVVDVDNKQSIEVGNTLMGLGEHSVREIEYEYQPIPEGRYVETGGGGRHLYFTYVAGCGGNRANVRPGIDVRGDGGYVVAPPSTHVSGHSYAFVNEDILPLDPPGWIVDLMRFDPGIVEEVGDNETVGEGGRNYFLHNIGAKYRRELGYPEWKLYGLLQAHNHKQCSPPLDSKEVSRIASNVAKYEYTPQVDIAAFSRTGEPPPIPEGGDLAISLFDLVSNPPKAPEPLINGVISVGTGVLLAGQPNVGKSWMVMDMAMAICSGEPWLDHYLSTQGGVLMIDEEGTEYGQYERFQMLLDGRNNMSAVGLPLRLAIGTGLRLDSDVGTTRIRRMLERYQPRLVVLDSLVRLHNGEENNAGNMSKFFEKTKELMRAYDTTFMFTHHVRKPSLESADPGDLIRGTTEIRAWPDTIFVITPGDDHQEVIFHHVKSRYSRRSEPFKVRMQIDEDANTARFAHAGEVDAGSSSIHLAHNKVLKAISDLNDNNEDATLLRIAEHRLVQRTERTVKAYMQTLQRAGAVDVYELSIAGEKHSTSFRIKGA